MFMPDTGTRSGYEHSKENSSSWLGDTSKVSRKGLKCPKYQILPFLYPDTALFELADTVHYGAAE